MKHPLIHRLAALVLALSFCLNLCACGGSKSATPTPDATLTALRQLNEQLGGTPDDNYRAFYEIFVNSFADSDGNGIGELKRVESKLA